MIAIIAILAAIVIVAINPARQLAQARNAQRASDLNAIQSAVHQYYIDHFEYPDAIPNVLTEICNTGAGTTTNCLDLAALVPTYLVQLPQNPSGGNYQMMVNGNQIALVAPGSKEEGLSGVALGTSTDAIDGSGGDDSGNNTCDTGGTYIDDTWGATYEGCWYTAASVSASCDDVCSSHSGAVPGSLDTSSCDVIQALGNTCNNCWAPDAPMAPAIGSENNQYSCVYQPSSGNYSSDYSHYDANWYRVCRCGS